MDLTNLLLVLHEHKRLCQFNELGREQFGLYKYANLRIIWSTSPFETVNRGHGAQIQKQKQIQSQISNKYANPCIIWFTSPFENKSWPHHTNTSQKFWKWWIFTMENLTVKMCWEIRNQQTLLAMQWYLKISKTKSEEGGGGQVALW